VFHALQAHSGKFGVKALALSFLHQKGCTVQFLQSFQGIFLFIDGWTLYIHGQNISLLHRFCIKPQVITGFTFVATNLKLIHLVAEVQIVVEPGNLVPRKFLGILTDICRNFEILAADSEIWLQTIEATFALHLPNQISTPLTNCTFGSSAAAVSPYGDSWELILIIF
jgi:hypothetical protein